MTLKASSALAYWQVVDRPLEEKPYTRELKHRFYFHDKYSIGIDGSGLPIKAGTNPLFERSLTPGKPKELEFQLGYLTKVHPYDKQASCAIDLRLVGETEINQSYTVPLRSIDLRSLTIQDMGSRYDYLMPAFKISLPETWTKVSAVAEVKGCGDGQSVFFDPKIWEHANDLPARRMLFFVADSVGKDWFENGREFMPRMQKFFSSKDAFLATNVVSTSTNTVYTTDMVVDQRYSSKSESKFIRGDTSTGLVSDYMNAGYDTYASVSNFLLVNENSQGGFRNLFQIDVTGLDAISRRSDEFRSRMVADWINRHPDHNVMMLTWSDVTHAWVEPPQIGSGYDESKLPYVDRIVRNVEDVSRQGRALNYLDAAFAPLFDNALVQASDVMFFSDHGLHFDSLQYGVPGWPRCFGESSMNNNTVGPDELRIFAGIRSANPLIKASKAEAGTLDWMYTLTKLNHPEVDTSRWQGRLVSVLSGNEPVVSFAQGRRNAMRSDGKHYLWTLRTCGDDGALTVLEQDEVTPAKPEIVHRLSNWLKASGLVRAHKIDLKIHQRSSACQVRVATEQGRDAKGAPLMAITGPDDGWFSKSTVYLTSMEPDMRIESSPPGCAEVRLGVFRRRTPISLAQSGLSRYLDQPAPSKTSPIVETTVSLDVDPRLFRLLNGSFVAEEAANTAGVISADLKSAMKAWGYIQDE